MLGLINGVLSAKGDEQLSHSWCENAENMNFEHTLPESETEQIDGITRQLNNDNPPYLFFATTIPNTN